MLCSSAGFIVGTSGGARSEKADDRGHNGFYVAHLQKRMERKRADLARGALSVRKISSLISQRAKSGVQMQWQFVMNCGLDSVRSQVCTERTPLARADDV